jgi:hypothetical protein
MMGYGGDYQGSGRLGNDESVMADSFQGGIADLESALMEGDSYEIDELKMGPEKMGQDMGQMNEQDMMLMQMLMQQMGGQ